MRSSRKIRKLFSPDCLASLYEHVARAIHPVDTGRILAMIKRDEIDRISQIYPRRAGARRINTWNDATYWIDINVMRAQDLWLDRTAPVRILDLGCGPGYFLYVCRFFGHNGIGFDTGDDPFFGAMVEHFDIPRVISRIEPGLPLPQFGEKFDLVTAYRVCFHRTTRKPDGTWVEWSSRDWKFFIDDVRARALKPNGRLLLDFNPRPDNNSFFTPEMRDFFRAEGARLFRSKALFTANPHERPRFKLTNIANQI